MSNYPDNLNRSAMARALGEPDPFETPIERHNRETEALNERRIAGQAMEDGQRLIDAVMAIPLLSEGERWQVLEYACELAQDAYARTTHQRNARPVHSEEDPNIRLYAVELERKIDGEWRIWQARQDALKAGGGNDVAC